jgi:hypothetical protein
VSTRVKMEFSTLSPAVSIRGGRQRSVTGIAPIEAVHGIGRCLARDRGLAGDSQQAAARAGAVQRVKSRPGRPGRRRPRVCVRCDLPPQRAALHYRGTLYTGEGRGRRIQGANGCLIERGRLHGGPRCSAFAPGWAVGLGSARQSPAGDHPGCRARRQPLRSPRFRRFYATRTD